MTHKLNILFLTLFLLFGGSAEAQKQAAYFENLDLEAGLSQSAVASIFQDKRGFMWFATQDGLNRYDGYTFVHYRKEDGNDKSLTNSYIRSISADSKGDMWLVTKFGLNRYNVDYDNFTRYVNRAAPYFELANEFNTIEAATDGGLWLGSEYGLAKFDPQTGQFENFFLSENKNNNTNKILSLHETDSDTLWVGTRRGFFIFSKKNKQFFPFKMKEKLPLNSLGIKHIHIDCDEIWLGTTRGLFQIKKFGKSTQQVFYFLHKQKDKQSLPANNITSLLKTGSGRFFLGSDGGGLSEIFSTDSMVYFLNYQEDKNRKNTLPDPQVQVIYESSDKILWIGTEVGGVSKLIFSDFIRSIQHLLKKANSSYENVIRCFAEDKTGAIWIGTNSSGLIRYNPDNQEFKQYKKIPYSDNSISSNSVRDLLIDNKGRIWIATTDAGISVFDPEHEKFYNITPRDKARSSSTRLFFDVFKDNKGEIWIGAYAAGLFHLTGDFPNDYQVENYMPAPNNANSLIDRSIFAIFEDSYGDFWFGSYSAGISRLKKEHVSRKLFTNYSKLHNKAANFTASFVLSIFEDSKRRLWLGTYDDGLFLFNREKNTFSSYKTQNGLPNNTIYGILEDDKGFLWLSTNYGISRFDTENQTFINFTTTDGLQSNEFNGKAFMKTKNGELYFGGVKGFDIIKPEKFGLLTKLPQVVITRFLRANKSVKIGKNSLLKKSITETKELIISYKDNIIKFEFSALSYEHPKKNKYAYRLENFNQEWQYTGSENRSATYTNLDPGTYFFHVKASNSEGVWNEKPTTLKLIVHPPFWRTYAFYVTAALSTLLLVVLLIAWREKQLKSDNLKLESVVKKRTYKISIQKQSIEKQRDELQRLNSTKDKFFSIIAHDLRNPFNSLLGFSDLLLSEYAKLSEEEKLSYLNIIKESAYQTFNLLENLLQWSRTQTKSIQFSPQQLELQEIVNEVFKLLSDSAKKKSNQLILGETKIELWADKNMLQTILRNLISNAIKFTTAGTIRVSASKKSGQVEIAVTDTGVGISPKNIPKLFVVGETKSTLGTDNEQGTGLGLIICREFVEKHGGKIWVKSQLNVGTSFIFTLPQKLESKH